MKILYKTKIKIKDKIQEEKCKTLKDIVLKV